MTTLQRLSTQELLVTALRTPLGNLVARPWFDRVALNTVAYWFFPLSRLWAAARAAEGSVDGFFETTGIAPSSRLAERLRRNLGDFETVRHRMVGIEREWEAVFFGADAPTPDTVLQAEDERLTCRNLYNNLRRKFIPLRIANKVQPVRWQIPSPADVDAVYGGLLADPARAFAPPDPMPEVTVSHRLASSNGEQSYWLRFKSPSPRMNDQVIARVYEPVDAENAPTLIFGHGICVEFDHWRGLVDEVEAMVQMGIRVVRPEAPWHGRRVPDGMYGGEKFIATAPMGALDLFTSAAQEWSVIMDWLRRTTNAPIAIGGSSLGAMTSQIITDKSRHWPERLRPDAAFLVTHCGHIEDAVVHGKLAEVWGIAQATIDHGWRSDLIRRYMPLLEAEGRPVIPPQNIVTVLGDHDNVTPFNSARTLIDEWQVPAENRFVYRRGHFSVPLGMMRDHAPLVRFRQILDRCPTGSR
ncbi:MAG: hypothetical protein ABJM26_13185 [Anderseniella sp.]